MKTKQKSLIYRPQKLIPGYKIEEGLQGFYAAVPDKRFKGKPFKIIYTNIVFNDQNTPIANIIEKEVENWLKAEKFRRFPDQWGHGIYTLGYFKMCEQL